MKAEDIVQYKPYLFTIAYNMLGDIVAAEDLVQDTFEKWIRLEKEDIQNAKSYLSRIIINMAIDRLSELKKERELYKGLWMPEPLLTDITQQPEEHTLEYAVLFLLEKLNPYERAVFVLKEVFDLPHEEIAGFLQTTTDNCRQLLHRAREKVRSPRKRQEADAERQQELLNAFLVAMYQKDFTKLREIFHADIRMYADGGGKMATALKPLTGIAKVIRFLEGIAKLNADAHFSIQPIRMNAREGTLVFLNASLNTVLYIETQDNTITELYMLRNPDKIKVKNW